MPSLPEEMKEDMHKIEPCSGHLKSQKEGALPEEMKEDVHKIESCAGHLKSQKEGVVLDERQHEVHQSSMTRPPMLQLFRLCKLQFCGMVKGSKNVHDNVSFGCQRDVANR